MNFQRVLLKLSGEALAGANGFGFDAQVMSEYAKSIADAATTGTQIAIVIGGGNIYRGEQGAQTGKWRVKGDQMGMLATVINALALGSALKAIGCKAIVYTAIRMEPVARLYSSHEAIEKLEEGYVALFAGGTGNPFFTTDTASALRAVEIKADYLLKGTRVDGIYTADPERDPTATRFDKITFDEVYTRNLKVMDLTAMTLCKENNLPIMVFDMDTPGNLSKLLGGDPIGTLVHN